MDAGCVPPLEGPGPPARAAWTSPRIGSQARAPQVDQDQDEDRRAARRGPVSSRDEGDRRWWRRHPSPRPEDQAADRRDDQAGERQDGGTGEGIGAERRLDGLEGEGPPESEDQRGTRLEQRPGEHPGRGASGVGPHERPDQSPPDLATARPRQPRGVFAGRADLRQRMGRCHRHQRHAAREPQPDPAEPAPPVARRDPAPDRDPRPGFRRPEQPPQPDRPEHRGDHQRREDQRGERRPPPEPPARDDPGQADPHRQRPHRHHARDRDAVPEAVPDERIPRPRVPSEMPRPGRPPSAPGRAPPPRSAPTPGSARRARFPPSPRVPALGSNPCP